MKEEDKFPRFKSNTFGDGTGWVFAGALVVCAHELIAATEVLLSKHNKCKDTSAFDLAPCWKAISKLKDTINATMESAYKPTSPPSGNPPKDPNWQKP